MPLPPPPLPCSPTTPAVAQSPLRHWREILADCGYPQDVLVVDAETFFDSEYSLSKLSTIEYIQDERFECLGWACSNGEDSWWNSSVLERVFPWGIDLDKVTLIMHHAHFDAAILAYRHDIHPPYIVDTLALARAWNARAKNGLKDLAGRWGLEAKGDTSQFNGVTRRRRYQMRKGKAPIFRPLITPKQEAALEAYATHDAQLTFELFTRLLPRLSNSKMELALQEHTLRLFTKPVLRMDMAAGETLKKDMQEEIWRSLNNVQATQAEISGNKVFEGMLCEALLGAGENAQRYFKPIKRGYVLALAKTDPERNKLLNHPDYRVRNLMQARVTVKSMPLHLARVDGLMAQANAAKGLLPVALKYHGAHTGRYSGDGGINLQNLPKHGIIARLKGLIMAPPGHKLIIADAAQIEARGIAWLADQSDLCDSFRAGRDVYSEFASIFFKRKVRKPKKDGIPAVEAEMERMRAFGKIAILGLGYGMGADKFASWAGVDIDTATRVVKLYRETYSMIPKLWYSIEDSFRYTARYDKPTTGPHGVRFHSQPDCDVVMTLPNGREIRYHRVQITNNGIRVLNYDKWEGTWGGSIVENIVQGFSRDVLCEAMLRLEALHVHTALTVHDELVCVIEDKFDGRNTDATKFLVCHELASEPSWAPGLPLAAESHVSDKYAKG